MLSSLDKDPAVSPAPEVAPLAPATTGGAPYRSAPAPATDKGRARAADILAAARAVLAAEGYAGLSMRSVANRLGLALSTVQHYYPSRDALVEAVLSSVMDTYQGVIDQTMAEMASAPPAERFVAVMMRILDDMRGTDVRALLGEVHALAGRSPMAERVQATMQRRARRTVYGLIKGMNPTVSDEEYQHRAGLVVSLLDGLAQRQIPYSEEKDTNKALRFMEVVKISFRLLAVSSVIDPLGDF